MGRAANAVATGSVGEEGQGTETLARYLGALLKSFRLVASWRGARGVTVAYHVQAPAADGEPCGELPQPAHHMRTSTGKQHSSTHFLEVELAGPPRNDQCQERYTPVPLPQQV